MTEKGGKNSQKKKEKTFRKTTFRMEGESRRDGFAISFSGVRSVTECTGEYVEFRTKDRTFRVFGEDMSITILDEEMIMICGHLQEIKF